MTSLERGMDAPIYRMDLKQFHEKIIAFEKEFGTNKVTIGAFLALFGDDDESAPVDLDEITTLLRRIANRTRQTRNAVEAQTQVLNEHTTLLARIAVAVESIDEKTKGPKK